MIYVYELLKKENLVTLKEVGKIHYEKNCEGMTSFSMIADMMKDCFQLNKKAEEYVFAIAYNTRMNPLGVFEIAHGNVNSVILNPREILIRMLLCGAHGFILIHNHPSNSVWPSQQDLKTTERIMSAGELIGLPLLDHIIVSEEGYYSFRENHKI